MTRPSGSSPRTRTTLAAVVSEAWRNVCTGTTRALTFSIALAATLGVLVWIDVSETAVLSAEMHTYVAAGSSTYTLVSDANIDGAACERLVSSGYVDAAGALRGGGDVRLHILPSNAVNVYEATPGLMRLIAPDRWHPDAAGAYLSPALAKAVAPVLSNPQERPRSPLLVAPVSALGTYPWPDDGRPAQLQYAVLGTARPTGAFDQCWVRSVDPIVDSTFLLRSALLHTPTDPADAQVSQLNPRLGEAPTAASDFASRPTRLSWLVGLFAGALLAAVSAWLRRLELACSRELGVPTTSQLAGTLLETLVWACAGAVLCAALLVARASQADPADRGALVSVGLPVMVAGVVGAVGGSLATAGLVRRRPVTAYLRTR